MFSAREDLMQALISLEPREAGTEVIEPAADFGDSEDSLHDRGRCPATCLIEPHTECVATDILTIAACP
jgi:hypothetical protein